MIPENNRILKIDTRPFKLAISRQVDSPLAVCSHERSGTHFLMNSLASCTSYNAQEFLNFDLNPLGSTVDFYSPESVKSFIDKISDINIDGIHYCASGIIKSHHLPYLFNPSVNAGLKILYIYRNPSDVLISYWKFLIKYGWMRGVKITSPAKFCDHQPCGASLRYQRNECLTFFDRWAEHVSSWLGFAEKNSQVYLVNYANLIADHAGTLKKACHYLEIPINSEIVLPSKDINVFKGADISLSQQEIQEVRDYCARRLKNYPNLEMLFIKEGKFV